MFPFTMGDTPSHSNSSGIIKSLMPLSVSKSINSWSAQKSIVEIGGTIIASMSSLFIRVMRLLLTYKIGMPTRYFLLCSVVGETNPLIMYFEGCWLLILFAILTLCDFVP